MCENHCPSNDNVALGEATVMSLMKLSAENLASVANVLGLCGWHQEVLNHLRQLASGRTARLSDLSQCAEVDELR